MALEAFKILNNQTPVYVSDILTYKSHFCSFRYTNPVEIPQVRTSTYGARFFRSTAAKIWSSLPQKLREITSAEQLGHKLYMDRGRGSAYARSAQTVKSNAYFYFSLLFMLNLQFNSSF